MNEQATAGPRVRASEVPPGVRIVDPIERAQFTLLAERSVEPRQCSATQFPFPVDTAVELDVETLETPHLVEVWVRDETMTVVADEVGAAGIELDHGRYTVELSSTPMKLYLQVEGALSIEASPERVRFASDSDRVRLGARSFHRHPAGTITTPAEPGAVATAISQFGSALKTTSPERSFPTLRGHPPLLELGEDLAVPTGVRVPETGVEITVPERLDAVFPVAPLAYYLGAGVEVGAEPRLRADGWSQSLTAAGDLETTVTRLLKHVFTLDCATRTEGLYDVALQVRRDVERAVDGTLDFARLYDCDPATRIRRYLELPVDDLARVHPTWKLTADVLPRPAHVETLPYLVDELAVVRCPSGPPEPEPVSFLPTADGGTRAPAPTDDPAEPPDLSPFSEPIFEPAPAHSLEQLYVGPGIPVGASKLEPSHFTRRLTRSAADGGYIRVVIVCNDPRMHDEHAVSEVYGPTDWLSFDVETETALTTDELAGVLSTDADFLHYIGHVDDAGLECRDGYLDVADLETVGIDAFLLNGCHSYEQGRALVDGGAVGGIVTLAEVANAAATFVGRIAARLLNVGFSLSATLDLLTRRGVSAREYTIIGDGGLTLVDAASGTPHYVTVEDRNGDTVTVGVHCWPTRSHGLGTMFQPFLEDGDRWWLNAGTVGTYEVSIEDLATSLPQTWAPLFVDDEVYWPTDADSVIEVLARD